MEVIPLNYPLDLIKINTKPKVMALGFFDGVHLGHQKVIKTAIQIGHDQQLPVAVMTFDKYPGIVFRQIEAAQFEYLTTLERKAELLQELGVDIMYVINFTSTVGHLAPQQFVDDYLVALGTQVVVAGFDYTYGQKDTANMLTLPQYAQDRFEIVTIPEQKKFTEKISSSTIRQALNRGDVDRANALLGYVYQTDGIVVHGEARGRTLGYPTANIKTLDTERLPGIGIYATEILVQDHWYPAMTSVGHNVTFGDHRPVTVEVNIFDFHQDIYGETIKLRWNHWLRGEEKFTDADALVAQLTDDEIKSRQYFNLKNKN
ncbi:riboflavin biosynthesis protein RibF [Lapidilactobacillus bayanensis]|uniref:riboflavin biosynthesis protein RibF n=1 Tax=Lapidilactobacillus bayanensis TaxID=2485998 RepID=UPI00177EBF21|nr:riboflavin biosynthesis protein RibF [Lapidilactobacillus bayanensis]